MMRQTDWSKTPVGPVSGWSQPLRTMVGLVLRNRFPLAGVSDRHPASAEWSPMFMLDLIVKDMELARDLAAAHGLTAEMTSAALAQYRAGQQAGLGALDYSAVYLVKRPDAR